MEITLKTDTVRHNLNNDLIIQEAAFIFIFMCTVTSLQQTILVFKQKTAGHRKLCKGKRVNPHPCIFNDSHTAYVPDLDFLQLVQGFRPAALPVTGGHSGSAGKRILCVELNQLPPGNPLSCSLWTWQHQLLEESFDG